MSAHPFSMFDPAGPHAWEIAGLSWQMIVVYGAVFVVTLLLLFVALLVRKNERPVLGSRFVIVAGIAIPAVILVIMLLDELRVHQRISGRQAEFQVEVIGHGWWFEVRYPAHDLVDANEIHVPSGLPVRYVLSAAGMLHSFWVPRLGGKRDMLPDHRTELVLEAGEPGVYRGTCTEYCAGQHAHMDFRLVAHEPDEFERWLERRRGRPSFDSSLLAGMEVFRAEGCASCHAITGVSRATVGPDLTWIGSRLTIGSGQFENSAGLLEGWIANPQALKPGNKMPRIYLSAGDLHAVTAYLRSLR